MVDITNKAKDYSNVQRKSCIARRDVRKKTNIIIPSQHHIILVTYDRHISLLAFDAA